MSTVLDLPQLVRGLPPEPPSELGPSLEAASRCFARHGIGRTSMADIGREARVSRSTIYRQLGGVEQAARLLLAREVHRLFAHLVDAVAGANGPEVIVTVLAETVTYARQHPVLTKVLSHEPDVIGPFLVTDLPAAIGQVAEMAEPLLDVAMSVGLIRRQDAATLAHWLVRLAVILILDPPPMPLQELLAAAVLPALDPNGAPP